MTVSYDAEPVVEEVSFGVSYGRLVGIVGPNGAGKSTMIKAVVGALPMDSGSVVIAGQTGRRAVKRVTYVPQRGSVDWDFPVTVRDVVEQGRYGELGLFSRFRKRDKDAVAEAIE
ncbi:MAG: ATP-binding cassette domain-containing protein, partial [Myxococcota bacterium]